MFTDRLIFTDRWSQDNMTLRHSSQAGFTLVELMISLTVVSIAIAAAFGMAFSLMNGFRGNRAAVQVESTARIVLDIMATGVRAASPGLVGGSVFDTCQGAFTTTIEVTNSNTGPDGLRVIHALGGALASTTTNHNIISDGTLDVVDNSTFERDTFVPAIIIDPIAGKGHLVEVMAPSGSPTTMETRIGVGCTGAVGAEDFGAGSFIVRAVQMEYRVDPPYLFVDPDGAAGPRGEIVVAAGIEDLQIAIAVEDNFDLTSITDVGAFADDDEWHYNVAGPPLDTPPPGVDAGGWTALRISVVGFASFEQKNALASARPALEDRSVGGSDFIRRRTYSTTIGLRNFSGGN